MNSDTGAAYDALIAFLYQAPIGLLQTTLEGEITMINPMAAQLLLPLVADGNLLNLFDALAGLAPQLRQLASEADASGGLVCDGLRVEHRPAGASEARTQVLSLRMLRLADGAVVVSVSDATEAVEREQQRLALGLRDASRIDPLTALPNRVVASERIASALEFSRRDPRALFAVLFVDCDRFDRIHLTLGQAGADELLRHVGERLNGALRQADGIVHAGSHEAPVAHLGGDQFVLVLQGLPDAGSVSGIAQRLVDAIARPFAIGERLVHISASVGVALGAQGAGDAESVLLDAGIAMHEAKRAGGARWDLFEPAMRERAARLGAIEGDLRCGIEAGQLFVVYQPIVTISGGECVGLEALVRWRHPERGIVPPAEFIGIAEETGLIGAIGAFVLEHACRQLAAWQRALGRHAPHSISVNLSRAQLLGEPILAQVRRALQASGLAARHLQLEVTESLAAQDEHVIAQLHQLKALGLTLALDDFGTGYSSLSSLHQLPVDVVKIDRSFVSQVESSAHHRVLVEATVMVARSLGMSTVAEGIETQGQLAALGRLHCDKAQGYLFARPMEAADASAWLARQAVPA